ncbi:MAG TPA: glycoside hydrolase family 140 protein [Pyrinomonadaceae bacterium]|nr:glycoside hydrolase family 140 protein [Pyrinomonadaceae bacterium]
MKRFYFVICLASIFFSIVSAQSLKVSSNGRFFTQNNSKPFFWLGDTGWLLFKKCSREETIKYLDLRQKQGFNVIQVMVLHDLKNTKNFYGDEALINSDVSKALITPGNNFAKSDEYDYWDHVEWGIGEAAKRNIYMALVPVWGSNVKADLVSQSQAKAYAEFLANRFKNKTNIIWLNGGDLRGDDHQNIWNVIGKTLKQNDKNHMIGFHPRGRTMSSEWFHNENWLDFNMFQSGHRNYAQDNSPDETHHFGEDNWKYVEIEYNLKPVKPTLDGEPSYENIPQGLHDPKQIRWNENDVRRYAYWSVFAGGAGFSYGENSVMQFYKKGDQDPAYGAENDWRESINAKGANQMQHLKNLMLSKPYFERVPANELIANQSEKYNYIAATKGKNYALFYTYTGREITVKMKFFSPRLSKYSWFNPRDGSYTPKQPVKNTEIETFQPTSETKAGNDWVLVLEN